MLMHLFYIKYIAINVKGLYKMNADNQIDKEKIQNERIDESKIQNESDEFNDYIGSGTFGTVKFLDEKNVEKRYEKYGEGTYSYNPCGIKELIFLSQFKCENLIELKSFKLDPKYLYLNMEFGGTSLLDILIEQNCEYKNNDEGMNNEPIQKKIDPLVDNYDKHILRNNSYIDRLNSLQQILTKIVPVIYYLHSNNIIHNEIKPDNILLHDDQENIRLIDFSATILATQHYSKCNINFRAPETYFKNETTIAVDIWGLGMTCLCFALNVFLCDRLGENTNDIHIKKYLQYQQSKEQFLRFDESKFKDHKALMYLIQKMLIFDPKKRITAAELLQDPLIYNHKLCKEITIHQFNNITISKPSNDLLRNKCIEYVYDILVETGTLYSFVQFVWIFDLFYSTVNLIINKYRIAAVASMIIAQCIHDTYIDNTYYYINKNDCAQNDKLYREELDLIITDILCILGKNIYISTFEMQIIKNRKYTKIKKIILSDQYYNKNQKQLLELYYNK
jgi:serine/threonine protein kinase